MDILVTFLATTATLVIGYGAGRLSSRSEQRTLRSWMRTERATAESLLHLKPTPDRLTRLEARVTALSEQIERADRSVGRLLELVYQESLESGKWTEGTRPERTGKATRSGAATPT